MAEPCYSLAIETSSRWGGVSLGRGDELLESLDLPEQQRHAVDLMPAIDTLAQRHGVEPRRIGEVYISIGPGSFTGLRIGVTTAKLLAWIGGAKLVAVPTLDVVVRNAPPPPEVQYVAVMLNAKRGQCFTGIYQYENEQWTALIEPSLLSPAEVAERGPRPLAVIADKLPEFDWPDGVKLLSPALARPRSSVVWQLGRELAAEGRFADPAALTPMYVRLPEAEEVWLAKQS